MRKFLLVGLVAAAVLGGAPAAFAGDDAADRRAAISLCRAQVAQQAGVGVEDARLDTLRVRARAIRVDIDLWKDRQLTNVRCDVTRGEALAIASISPTLTTATAAR